MKIHIETAESPQEMQGIVNRALATLEESGATIQDVRVDNAGSKLLFYATILYEEDLE